MYVFQRDIVGNPAEELIREAASGLGRGGWRRKSSGGRTGRIGWRVALEQPPR
jgi:hypothetical protein